MKVYIKPRKSSNKYEVTNSVVSVKWSGKKSDCARRLDLVFASDINGSIPVPCEVMDIAYLYGDKGLLFQGRIWSRTKKTAVASLEITCFDDGYYLKKCDAFYKFSGKTPKEIVSKIASDYNIKLGDVLAPTNKITRNYIGVSLYKIIQDAYTRAKNKNNVQYQIVYNGDKLCIRKRGNVNNEYRVESEKTLSSADVKESAEGVVTRVKIYSSSGNFVKNVDDANGLKEFGLITKILTQSADDNRTDEAKEILKENTFKQTISVTALGDESCKTGDGIYVKEPVTGVTGLFYIDEDIHQWSKGCYTNKLILNFKNLMESVNAGSDKVSSNSNTNAGYINLPSLSAKVNKRQEIIDKVLYWMRTHTTAASGWKYSQVKRWQDGWRDCSSFVYSAWKYAGCPLTRNKGPLQTSSSQVLADETYFIYGDSKTLGRFYTNVNFNLLQPGDMIFYAFNIPNGNLGNISHIATVYDKKNIIHARNDRDNILIEPISYGKNRIVAVKRLKNLW